MSTQPLHHNAFESDQQPPLHERLVTSMFTPSPHVGLSGAQLTQGTMVVYLAFSEAGFAKPIRHGETIYAETLVVDKRPSQSQPGEGVVSLEHIARNQDGDIVAPGRKTLVRMRPVGEAAR